MQQIQLNIFFYVCIHKQNNKSKAVLKMVIYATVLHYELLAINHNCYLVEYCEIDIGGFSKYIREMHEYIKCFYKKVNAFKNSSKNSKYSYHPFKYLYF